MSASPTFRVRKTPCPTCIYRADCSLDLDKLEREVTDEHGAIVGHRICHHHTGESNVCCRGFYNRHKRNLLTTRLAMMFGLVEETDEYGLR